MGTGRAALAALAAFGMVIAALLVMATVYGALLALSGHVTVGPQSAACQDIPSPCRLGGRR